MRSIDWSKEELAVLKPLCLITAKPAMFVGNVAEDGFENNPYLDRLRDYAAKQKAPVVAICAKTEAELADMDDADRQLFLAEMGQTEPGLNRLIRAAFTLLGLQTYFTAGAEGGPRLDGPDRRHRAAGRRRDPHRLRARLHPGPDDRLRRLRHARRRTGREGRRQDARRRQGLRRQGRRRHALPVQRLIRDHAPARAAAAPRTNAGPQRAVLGRRGVVPVLLTAATYALAGWLALLLAIPPSYASPLWPAAGIALACVLCLGRGAIAGVALGAFAATSCSAQHGG